MTSMLQLREVFEFLDNLREEGSCNMYGASGPIQCAFGLGRHEAQKVLELWMKTFSKEFVGERTRKAYILLMLDSKK